MPSAKHFLDTNVLLYAVSRHPSEADKTTRAAQLLAQPDRGISVQVVQEFFYNATVKLERPMTREEAVRFLEPFLRLEVVPIRLELFRNACRVSARYQISYWDAAIISAAKELGAAIVYSEDLAHGQSYEGVTVVNPFL